jgi:hypothetical protein
MARITLKTVTPKCVLNDLRFPAHDGTVIDEAKPPAPAPKPPAHPDSTPKPLVVLGDQNAATCTDGRCD